MRNYLVSPELESEKLLNEALRFAREAETAIQEHDLAHRCAFGNLPAKIPAQSDSTTPHRSQAMVAEWGLNKPAHGSR